MLPSGGAKAVIWKWICECVSVLLSESELLPLILCLAPSRDSLTFSVSSASSFSRTCSKPMNDTRVFRESLSSIFYSLAAVRYRNKRVDLVRDRIWRGANGPCLRPVLFSIYHTHPSFPERKMCCTDMPLLISLWIKYNKNLGSSPGQNARLDSLCCRIPVSAHSWPGILVWRKHFQR